MLPCAHIGFGILLSQICSVVLAGYFETGDQAGPLLRTTTVVASLLPDIIDKPLHWGRQCKATRSVGHTILFMCGVSATVLAVDLPQPWHDCQPAFALAVSLGVASHLISDLLAGYVPLFWPLQPFRYPSMIHTRGTKTALRACEVVSFLWLCFCTDTPQAVFKFMYQFAHVIQTILSK